MAELDAAVVSCRACPRLVRWREEVSAVKRAAFRDETYWARPVPGFGPIDARMAIIGLAPAAHGGNRTGRLFTGDRSGAVLFAALHAIGLASRPDSVRSDDGMELFGIRMTAPVKCAPPENKPTPAERETCRPWLIRELELLRPSLQVILVLGAFGWNALWPALSSVGWVVPIPRPRFGHGALCLVESERGDAGPLTLIGSYHVSQQNTFTGRLTPSMLEEVLRTAAEHAGLPHR
jgi:uracil-DNA glycosylase family 4